MFLSYTDPSIAGRLTESEKKVIVRNMKRNLIIPLFKPRCGGCDNFLLDKSRADALLKLTGHLKITWRTIFLFWLVGIVIRTGVPSLTFRVLLCDVVIALTSLREAPTAVWTGEYFGSWKKSYWTEFGGFVICKEQHPVWGMPSIDYVVMWRNNAKSSNSLLWVDRLCPLRANLDGKLRSHLEHMWWEAGKYYEISTFPRKTDRRDGVCNLSLSE